MGRDADSLDLRDFHNLRILQIGEVFLFCRPEQVDMESVLPPGLCSLSVYYDDFKYDDFQQGDFWWMLQVVEVSCQKISTP